MIAPRACLVPLECSDGTRPTNAISSARSRSAGIAELGGDREGGQVVDAAEAAQAFHARAQRLEVEQGAQILLDGAQPRDGFIDRAEIGAMGLVEAGNGHVWARSQNVVPLRPGLLGAGEAAAVAQEEFRETVTGAKQIGPDIFATPQQITRGFFLLGRNVNGRERARRDTARPDGPHRVGQF